MHRAAFTSIAAPLTAAAMLAGCGSSKPAAETQSNAGYAPASAAASSASTRAAAGGPGSASGGAASAGPAALITTKHSSLGTVLAYGPKRLTVYLFEADHGSQSACSGACAGAWPPVTGSPRAAGTAQASKLGTVKRADGTMQVTYAGHPLYLFVKDTDSSDTYGQGLVGFGAPWYALGPSGSAVTKH